MLNLHELFRPQESRYPIKDILRWLWRAWRGNRLQACINASLGLLSVVVSLSQVWAVKNAIDVASHNIAGNIYWAVGIIGLLTLCSFAISISGIWVRNILGIRAQNRMQQKMLDRILHAQWQGREQMHSGDVINRLVKDVSRVVSFLTETIPSSVSVVALFTGAFCFLFSMDWLLAVVVVAMLPLFISVSKLYVKRMRGLTREIRKSDSKVQSVLQETVQNRTIIKTLEGNEQMVDRLESTQSELRHHVVKRTAFSVFSNLILNFGFSLGYLMAFLWSALRMSAGTLTFGGMTAFLQLVNKIQGPARSLTHLVPQFVGVCTAAERLMELEENPLEEQGDPIALSAPCGICLDNVTYAYDEKSRHIIDGLSFDFTPGSCTAILGETGAGKTTLVRMILALIRPQQGTAYIYNKECKQPLSPLHRCNLIYVPQGNTLLSGSVRDNLRLGRVDASDEEMNRVLRQACAEFVFELPEGLDTICSESGGGLSEGQAQRIAIARALLREGSIILLDEATSALDSDTEQRLLQNILERQDKTVIFITHRPAVVDYCDQVLHVKRTPKS